MFFRFISRQYLLLVHVCLAILDLVPWSWEAWLEWITRSDVRGKREREKTVSFLSFLDSFFLMSVTWERDMSDWKTVCLIKSPESRICPYIHSLHSWRLLLNVTHSRTKNLCKTKKSKDFSFPSHRSSLEKEKKIFHPFSVLCISLSVQEPPSGPSVTFSVPDVTGTVHRKGWRSLLPA